MSFWWVVVMVEFFCLYYIDKKLFLGFIVMLFLLILLVELQILINKVFIKIKVYSAKNTKVFYILIITLYLYFLFILWSFMLSSSCLCFLGALLFLVKISLFLFRFLKNYYGITSLLVSKSRYLVIQFFVFFMLVLLYGLFYNIISVSILFDLLALWLLFDLFIIFMIFLCNICKGGK